MEKRVSKASGQQPSPDPSKATTKKKVDDSASYGKTIGGKLKLKGVEMKKTKQKKSDKGDPNPLPPSDTASQKTPSQLLQDRIKKKV